MLGFTIFHEVVNKKLYLAQNLGFTRDPSFTYISTADSIVYDPICDDFGPMNMLSIIRFIEMLDKQIAAFPLKAVVYDVENGWRNLTNAIFLLGSYLILKHYCTAEDVDEIFCLLKPHTVAYRDATYSVPDFHLTLRNCWDALERGRRIGWIDLPRDERAWGCIDPDEYEFYENPLDADLHEVVPGKFVAFRGPTKLDGISYCDDGNGYRLFDPSYYVHIFKELGVSTIVRLNDPEYNKEEFTSNGFEHHDLDFKDCALPSWQTITQFLEIAHTSPGLVAIHCKAGLGRTGTLIALYMMQSYHFSAREAIGWLRIMRPGSVVGRQQHFLCEFESRMRSPGLRKALSLPLPNRTHNADGGCRRARQLESAAQLGSTRSAF